MSEQQINQNLETIGLGVKSPTPIIAPPEKVWAAMVHKVYNIEQYMPVTNVKITDIVPGKQVYREMLYDGKPVHENLYFDKARYEIRAVLVGHDDIRFNLFDPETGLLEYWQENGKGERIPWDISKIHVLAAMQTNKEVAEAST